MKVLFDYQIFHLQRHGGISRYYANLIENLNNRKVATFTSSFFFNNIFYPSKRIHRLSYLLSSIHPKVASCFQYIDKRLNNFLIKEGNFDVFHPTYYDAYFLNKISNKPYILTVHDMIHEIFLDKYKNKKQALYIIYNKKKLIENASKIIAVSNSTKKDILKFYDIPSEKIEVIYHGFTRFKTAEFVKTPKKYILIVGLRDGYKNFNFFIEAISDLLIDENIYLICAGGGKFSKQEILKLENLKVADKVIQIDPNDNQLYYLYSNASVFIFPSLYEGFGLPVLEAFYCKTPIILSDICCFREICANAALYFDATNKYSLLRCIDSVLKDKNLKNKMILNGQKRLNNFSWPLAARKTLQVYSKVSL